MIRNFFTQDGKKVMFKLGLACSALMFSHMEAGCDLPCDMDGFYVGAEVLCWKPMHSPIFANRRLNSGNGGANPSDVVDRYFLGDYSAGVRAHVGYEQCNYFFDLSYLHLSSTEDVSTEIGDYQFMQQAGGLGFGLTDDEESEGTTRFRYQNIDAVFAHDICSSCDLSLFTYGNVRWVKIDFKNEMIGIPTDSDAPEGTFDLLQRDSHFNGGGFGLGFGGKYNLCGGFSLRGKSGIMALIGSSKLHYYAENWFPDPNNLGSINQDNGSKWNHIIPAWDFRLGLAYECTLCSWMVELEVGYELNEYFNVLQYSSENFFVTGSAGISPFTTQNVGFGGPYFSLSVRF